MDTIARVLGSCFFLVMAAGLLCTFIYHSSALRARYGRLWSLGMTLSLISALQIFIVERFLFIGVLGGSALYGYSSEGQYYLGYRGEYVRTHPVVWWAGRANLALMAATLIAGGILMGAAMRKWAKRTGSP